MNCFTSFYSVKCAKIKFLVSLISCFIDHQQLTLAMESTERFEPGMIGGRTSYCRPEAIPARPT